MKKIILMLLVFTVLIGLAGCDLIKEDPIKDLDDKTEENGNNEIPELEDDLSNKNLDIFYLNDTHGAILENGDEIGLAAISNLVLDSNDKNEKETLFLAGGDMFQGQLISNSNKGELMIKVLNEMKLDAFVLGNHEFDWGLDVILDYFNPSTPGTKANFPLLGANVIDKRINKRPENIKPYTILNKNGLNVGIIGTIGFGLESSIATLRVKDYEFTDPLDSVRKYANEIDELVDVIIVVNHSGNNYFNSEVVKIDKVKALFNGHTHQNVKGVINDVPYLQAGSNGKYVGFINLNISFENNRKIKSYTYKYENYNKSNNSLLRTKNTKVSNIIDSYYEEIRNIYEDTILTASSSMTKNDLAVYLTKIMSGITDSVISFQNYGGTRAEIYSNQEIKASDIFQIFPFDNQLIYFEIKGSKIKSFINNRTFIFDNSINYNYLNDNEYYRVATNDYVFYNEAYGFINEQRGTEVVSGDLYEIFLQQLVNLKNSGQLYFSLNDPIITNNTLLYNFFKEDNNLVSEYYV